jgi:hypothetical protein
MDSSGHVAVTRTGPSATEAYRNGGSLGVGSDASQTLPSLAFFIAAINNNGTPLGFTTRRIAVVSFGQALSAAEVSAFHAATQTYLQAVGAV